MNKEESICYYATICRKKNIFFTFIFRNVQVWSWSIRSIRW
jgi:hypothetical protein